MGLILKILNKYNLFVFLTNYTKNADFQGKSHCKRIVVNAVDQKHDNDWQTRINSDNDINQFREIHISVYIANAWKFPTNFFELRPAKFVVKLFSSLSNNNEDTEENTTEKTTLHRRLHNTKDNTTQSTILHMYKTQHYTKDYTTQTTTLHIRQHSTKDNITHKTTLHITQ
jgi:hypothetical protein